MVKIQKFLFHLVQKSEFQKKKKNSTMKKKSKKKKKKKKPSQAIVSVD